MSPSPLRSILWTFLFIAGCLCAGANGPLYCIGAPSESNSTPNATAIPTGFWAAVQQKCTDTNSVKVTDSKRNLKGFLFSYGGWTVKAYDSTASVSCSDRFGSNVNEKKVGTSGGDLGNIVTHCKGFQGAMNHQSGKKNNGLTFLFYDPPSQGAPILAGT